MNAAWKPTGYTTLSPYLVTKDAEGVIEFLRTTLGGELLRRFDMPDGSIMHAEVRIDDTVVMLGEAGEGWPAVPAHLHVYVPDVDATHALALKNGATEVQEPTQKEGEADRRGGVEGPGGNTWWFATLVDDEVS